VKLLWSQKPSRSDKAPSFSSPSPDAFAGGADPALHPIVARRKAEGLSEATLELTYGEFARLGQDFRRRILEQVLLQHLRGGTDLSVLGSDRSLAHAHARDPEDADDLALAITDRIFARDVPVGQPDRVQADFDPIQDRLTRTVDDRVVGEIGIGHRPGRQILVRLEEHLPRFAKTVACGPESAGVEMLAGAILEETQKARERIEDRHSLHVDDHLAQILLLPLQELGLAG
jgi:hypothetical protein